VRLAFAMLAASDTFAGPAGEHKTLFDRSIANVRAHWRSMSTHLGRRNYRDASLALLRAKVALSAARQHYKYVDDPSGRAAADMESASSLVDAAGRQIASAIPPSQRGAAWPWAQLRGLGAVPAAAGARLHDQGAIEAMRVLWRHGGEAFDSELPKGRDFRVPLAQLIARGLVHTKTTRSGADQSVAVTPQGVVAMHNAGMQVDAYSLWSARHLLKIPQPPWDSSRRVDGFDLSPRQQKSVARNIHTHTDSMLWGMIHSGDSDAIALAMKELKRRGVRL